MKYSEELKEHRDKGNPTHKLTITPQPVTIELLNMEEKEDFENFQRVIWSFYMGYLHQGGNYALAHRIAPADTRTQHEEIKYNINLTDMDENVLMDVELFASIDDIAKANDGDDTTLHDDFDEEDNY